MIINYLILWKTIFLFAQYSILQKEVEDDEKRLVDLSCEQQEFIYDREAESFDEVLPDGDVDPEKGGLPIDTETDQKKESWTWNWLIF